MYLILYLINQKPIYWHVSLITSVTSQNMDCKFVSAIAWSSNIHVFFLFSSKHRSEDGVKLSGGNLFMPYKSIFQDVRQAFDYIHVQVRRGDSISTALTI